MNKALQSFLKHEETTRRLVLITLLYLLPAYQALESVLDPDIWWHLRTGQWIVEHGTVPTVDEFSSYGMGKPWLAYSWLFEVLVYSLYRMFGLVGIVLYSVAFSLLIAAALHRLARRFELNFPAEIALTAAGVIALSPLYSPRPWLFTILFFVIEIDWLFLARRQGKTQQLFFLPLIFVLWANVHIQFCYGLYVLGLATLEPLIEQFLPHLQVDRHALSFSSLALILTACVAATLLTPYHVHLYQTILDFIPQTGQFPQINEMQAMAFRGPWDWFVLMLTVGAAFSLGWTRELHLFPLLLLVTGIFLSFRTRRDVWFVIIAAIPIIADVYASRPSMDRFALTKLRLASCTGALLAALFVLGWRRDLFQAQLEAVVAEHYPAAAVAAVHEHDYPGPLFNDYGWGGFLIWSLRTPLVVMDNRASIYGSERVTQFFKTWEGNEGWNADPDLNAARLVIANRGRPLASLLRRDPRFELVYEDKISVVFVTRASASGQATAQGVSK